MARKVYCMITLTIIMTIVPLLFNLKHVDADNDVNYNDDFNFYERYSTVLSTWKNEGLRDDIQFLDVINPSNFILPEGDVLLSRDESKGYNDRVFYWANQQTIIIPVEVEKTGLYELYLDYYSMTESVIPIEMSITINGEIQFYEASQITLETLWQNETNQFDVDRFGNDVLPRQIQYRSWRTTPLRDTPKLYSEPLKFRFNSGQNTISLTNLSGELLLGKVTIRNHVNLPLYQNYLTNDSVVSDYLYLQQAETPFLRNSASIRPGVSKETRVEPFDVMKLRLNILAAESYRIAGQRVDYQVSVPQNGYYFLTFKVMQNARPNAPVFRTLYINGQIPFEEAKNLPFYYTPKYENVTLRVNNEPMKIYLTKGVNTISLEVNASVFRQTYEQISDILSGINDLTLNIKKLTGNRLDENRDWNITSYLPSIQPDLSKYASILQDNYNYMIQLNNTKKESQEAISIRMAIDHLKELSKKPNEIPKNLTILSQGSSSVAQLLSDVLPRLIEQPLNIDAFYIHGTENELPKAQGGVFENLWVGIKRFVLSFFSENYNDRIEEDELEIWVNRSRQYADLIQNITDNQFTKKTGIKVRFSLMANEGKLLLAYSADNQPDVAMSVSAWIPYEYALRGAVYNLRENADFDDFIKIYEPGALIPMVLNDGVYGVPETQNFFVLFYRRDILNKLNIPVPTKWSEVIGILPELQRYGMNFYIPLANPSAFKSFETTAPFIYQRGGDLYSNDGMRAAIDSVESIDAIRFMTELFTIYSMPLQTPSFYNDFRYGRIPIGVSDYGTYIQLLNAAPEIAGLWDIALYPGMERANGEINRDAPGAQQSLMIFDKSEKKEEAWKFIKWWMSTDVQAEFADTLTTTLGREYMWNSANVEAFSRSSWPTAHKRIILEQWQHLREVPKIPGSYIVERELSNIWNRVVFDGVELRNAVDDSIIKMNKEINRKMQEFGYIENNQIIKKYVVPSREQIERWVKKDEEE